MKQISVKPVWLLVSVLVLLSLLGLAVWLIADDEPNLMPAQVNNEYKFAGEAAKTPWSGWWWPFHINLPNHLYDPQGPMAKYDALAVAQGLGNPGTRAWERQNHYADRPGEEWYGHCNGWAAAAVLEPEPVRTQTAGGIRFNPEDIKGILSEWHWWDPAVTFIGTRYDGPGDNIDDVNPVEFHKALISFIGERGRPLIFDISGGTQERNNPQIWNYPAYRYQMEYAPQRNNPEKIHVRCRVWLADSSRPNFQGTAPMLKTYYYWLSPDTARPTAGGWERSSAGGWDTYGDSQHDHPDFLWYPGAAQQHQVLDRKQIDQIIGGGVAR